MAKKIAIDAGHGSNTAGKRTPDGYREHWINVECCRYLETALKRCGFSTLRVAWDDANAKDDADVALSTRQKQIKSAKCDASISIHANAHGSGSEWTSGEGVSTHIHNSSASVGDSAKFGKLIQNNLVKGTKQKDRGVCKQALAMCNCRTMGTKASVLVELAFMTNKKEAELLKDSSFLKEQAEDICRGTCEYFGVKYVSSGSSSIKKDEPKKEETKTPVKESSNTDKKVTPVAAKNKDAKLAGTYIVNVDADDVLNVRKDANSNSDLIYKLKKGTAVKNYGYYNEDKNGKKWLLIDGGGKVGYAHSAYLKKK